LRSSVARVAPTPKAATAKECGVAVGLRVALGVCRSNAATLRKKVNAPTTNTEERTMKIIRFKNREAINRNAKNKGAVSAEYILVAVCVALFAMWGLRTFGGLLTNKLNDTATLVGKVTNNPDQKDEDIKLKATEVPKK
jgi:hypothetical protein